jgi:hypothetical protein
MALEFISITKYKKRGGQAIAGKSPFMICYGLKTAATGW